MGNYGKSFIKGGLGCLLGFLALGLSCVLIGGYMHIDIFGAILLFVIGGCIGLIIQAVYQRGRRDAVSEEDNLDESIPNQQIFDAHDRERT